MTKTLTGNPDLVDPKFDSSPNNPLLLLQTWLHEAKNLNVQEPYALTLSTVDDSYKPSSRVVLLKDCDESGITFGSSSKSQKGIDLRKNCWAAGNLWWRETLQQISFQGKVSKLSNKLSDQMFQERSRSAQAVAIASNQSNPLSDQNALSLAVQSLINSDKKLSRPGNWHAYHLLIHSIEFWHGSKDRMHKRLKFMLKENRWHREYLQP